MERYTMFFNWKSQYCQNDYTTQGNIQMQCNPQIQCSPIKLPMEFFTGVELKFFKLYGNTKDPE